jgi:hypothetical protein
LKEKIEKNKKVKDTKDTNVEKIKKSVYEKLYENAYQKNNDLNDLNKSPSNKKFLIQKDLRNFKEGRYEDVINNFDKSRAIKRGINFDKKKIKKKF